VFGRQSSLLPRCRDYDNVRLIPLFGSEISCCLPSPAARNNDQCKCSIAIQTLDRDQRIRSDAELDVDEDAETNETENQDKRNVRSIPADYGRFVESEVDHDQA